ncbi:DUF4303 domain-containing protein [Snodgrassella alvi]|uniref:DUF4303 domain-containing protein n=1 Tax=Snodgrassella alvi TaxID=1196083 RepID=A0A2N9WV31_9NEIS|nr:DUF4303 domain-containing protein [Snodgrassella alvi]PIT12832.1 hypothetical protein BGI33_12050 [Snodgrassella alvi]PIT15351.1 hypothetical protein BGI34_11895 [Snodgrassella alvi]PIT16710.1 hypothetical protein BGI32_03940 [Snodgrassella alvi]
MRENNYLVSYNSKISKKILDFSINGVEKFLIQHPELRFYAFAFDCNVEYGEINLCFNTEHAFSKVLNRYQNGDFAENYRTTEAIYQLRYNTGDWEYQCFDTLYVFSEEELENYFNKLYPNDVNDDYGAWKAFANSLLDLFTKQLVEFSKTDIFKKIPKTNDFKFFCIDHDEDIEEALQRMNLVLPD